MGSKHSTLQNNNNNNNNNNTYCGRIQNNQCGVPDVVLREVVSYLSFTMKLHQNKWNPLSLSLVCSYWLKYIVYRSLTHITFISTHNCLNFYNVTLKRFLAEDVHYDPSTYAYLKYLSLQKITVIFPTKANPSPKDIKKLKKSSSDENIPESQSIVPSNGKVKPNHHRWVDDNKELLQSEHMPMISLTLVNLPLDCSLKSLVPIKINKLRIYSSYNPKKVLVLKIGNLLERNNTITHFSFKALTDNIYLKNPQPIPPNVHSLSIAANLTYFEPYLLKKPPTTKDDEKKDATSSTKSTTGSAEQKPQKKISSLAKSANNITPTNPAKPASSKPKVGLQRTISTVDPTKFSLANQASSLTKLYLFDDVLFKSNFDLKPCLSELPSLTDLTLVNLYQLQQRSEPVFGNLNKLTRLSIDGVARIHNHQTSITISPDSAFYSDLELLANTLQILKLKNIPLKFDKLSGVLRSMTKLRRLTIDDTNASEIAPLLDHLETCENIQRLSINYHDDLLPAICKFIENNSTVRTLAIANLTKKASKLINKSLKFNKTITLFKADNILEHPKIANHVPKHILVQKKSKQQYPKHLSKTFRETNLDRFQYLITELNQISSQLNDFN